MLIVFEFIFGLTLFGIFYHLIGYPFLLRFFASHKKNAQPSQDDYLNHFVFVIPMYNEEVFIQQKIESLAALDYPADKFEVFLLDDGSTDKTHAIAMAVAQTYPLLKLHIKSYPINKGKVALFNQIIPTIADNCILFFSDVSSNLAPNVLQRANMFFNNHKIGAFSANYIPNPKGLHGEITYWHYQSYIQSLESHLGTPMGYHGTGYAIRKSLWEPLAPDTINDDFVMPMKVIAKGALGVFDKDSISKEVEHSSEKIDWNRRVRIACGNIQQVLYLKELLSPSHGFIAWMFFSGKTLRVFLPWFFILNFISSFILSFDNQLIFVPILFIQCFIYLIALMHSIFKFHSRFAKIITYFIKGQVSIFVGWLRLTNYSGHWQRANTIPKSSFIHPVVKIIKWIIDKSSAILGLALLLLLFPLIAILIKRASPGPIFYKQLRVGKTTAQCTQLFYIYKFRTMNNSSGPNDTAWTQENDPRIYPFGAFLRRTHLDELPQFFNVLKGDMSLVGPRPERPNLYPFIEKQIPFYRERLYGVLPGLTGLAQVSRGPDREMEDVRKKVAFDHAYAMHLTKPWIWLKLELVILLKTIKVVFFGKEL